MTEENKTLELGMTAEQWVELLNSDSAKNAKKAINYLDDKQIEEMTKFLDGPSGRKDWRSRGYQPRFRPLTSSIVEKSGRLFKDAAPQFEIFRNNQTEPDDVMNQVLSEELSKIEWSEFCSNQDQMTRLLKTTLILWQYDLESSCLVPELLHRGNCAVVRSGTGKMLGLIHRTSAEDRVSSYRLYTPEVIHDLFAVDVGGRFEIAVSNTEPNPYGIIPASAFYDTRTPRSGFWVDGGMDLVQVNEMVNIHLTDNEQAISWMKRPMIYTNADLEASNGDSIEVAVEYGQALPHARAAQPGLIAGPDKIMSISFPPGETPFLDYKTPQVDLKPIDEVMNDLVTSFASDWSVRIKTGGSSANSGFQLVVEEIDNLELRKQRQRLFESAYKRSYRVLRVVLNTALGKDVFSDDSDLFVQFPEVKLPVDAKEQVEVFKLKMDAGVANQIDYLTETKGITREEAMSFLVKIAEENAALANLTTKPEVTLELPKLGE
jgi:hypothetical protein